MQWSMRRRIHHALVAPEAPTVPDLGARFGDPIIVVGMHRSGTSVVTRAIEAMGVHVGGDLARENHESLFFLRCNHTVLDVAHARWDWPTPAVEFFADDDAAIRLAALMGTWLDSRFARRYWSPGSARRADVAYGWKDPRTSLTWPIWHALFPRATWVHVRRSVDGVAASLRTRSRRLHTEGEWHSWRTLEPSRSAELHAEYLASIERLERRLPSGSMITIDYEDLVAAPVATLRTLADAGIGDPGLVECGAALVRPRD